MRRLLPVIHESSQYLHKLMKAETDTQRHSRLHLLYLIKSEHVRRRGKAADVLGVHRHTVGAWLNLYQERGLMDIAPHPGAPSPLTQSELRRLRWKLRQPEEFGSYTEIQQWIFEKFAICLKSKIYSLLDCITNDSLSPKRLAQPIA